jgi:hypothetical protein
VNPSPLLKLGSRERNWQPTVDNLRNSFLSAAPEKLNFFQRLQEALWVRPVYYELPARQNDEHCLDREANLSFVFTST